MTGGDGVNAGDATSCCFRVTGGGAGAEDEVEEEVEEAEVVLGGAVEHSCLRVTGGEGEEDGDEEAGRPFTSSLTLLLVLLF